MPAASVLLTGSPTLPSTRRPLSHLPPAKHSGRIRNPLRRTTTRLFAGKKPVPGGEGRKRGNRRPTVLAFLPTKVPKTTAVLARCAAAVFALGFVDAGYSGDWSRINVISKETEELLKYAAFLVVPLCTFFIFSGTKEEKGSP